MPKPYTSKYIKTSSDKLCRATKISLKNDLNPHVGKVYRKKCPVITTAYLQTEGFVDSKGWTLNKRGPWLTECQVSAYNGGGTRWSSPSAITPATSTSGGPRKEKEKKKTPSPHLLITYNTL